MTHYYDLAGNVILSNNGLTTADPNAVTMGYGYDGANHLQLVTSTRNDGLNALFQATYYNPATN